MSTGMELLDSPMVMVQYGLALAVPAVLAAIMNLGCGKKRDQPPRPGAKKTLSKSAKPAGASSKSKRASKSSSASAKSGKSSKKDKSGKSKKSASKDKSGKASKKSSKKDKSSKSSKSKKSKRDLKSKTDAAAAAGTASQRSDAAKQPTSAATREAEKRAAAKQTAVALANDNSAKSAPTQVASASLKQPPSGGALDGNANVAVATGAGGTTALVAIGGDSTRELKMEPAELRWSSAGGMQKISLINQSAERQAIKVKCSDNNVYRVNPVYAIVEPGQTLNVDVMRQNGSNKVDKIVFVTARAGLEENPKNAFKPGAAASMMVLPLLATSAAAAHNQPALAV